MSSWVTVYEEALHWGISDMRQPPAALNQIKVCLCSPITRPLLPDACCKMQGSARRYVKAGALAASAERSANDAGPVPHRPPVLQVIFVVVHVFHCRPGCKTVKWCQAMPNYW